MRCCAPTATLARWILPRAIATGMRSKNSRLGSRHTEVEVAQSAIDSAKSAAAEKPNDGVVARREHHPGYYLISEGRHALEAKLGFRAPVRDWIARANKAAGIKGYLGTIAVVTAVIVACGAGCN